jgi:hypothetical protein
MQEREERLKTINWYFFVPGSMHHQGGLESGMLDNFFEIIRFFHLQILNLEVVMMM